MSRRVENPSPRKSSRAARKPRARAAAVTRVARPEAPHDPRTPLFKAAGRLLDELRRPAVLVTLALLALLAALVANTIVRGGVTQFGPIRFEVPRG